MKDETLGFAMGALRFAIESQTNVRLSEYIWDTFVNSFWKSHFWKDNASAREWVIKKKDMNLDEWSKEYKFENEARRV